MKNLQHHKTAMQANCIAAILFAFLLGFVFPKTANAHAAMVGSDESSVNYGIWINGVQVTSENCADLSVIDGVSGTVRFAPETYTLYLESATITAETGIYNYASSGLIINVTGENHITVTNGNAINFTDTPSTIKGYGTLNIESQSSCGIFFEKSLEIDDCTVTAKGKWGIVGDDGAVETLTIHNATVMAKGSSGSICDIRSLTLDGCDIVQPRGASFNETLNAVALNGQIVKDQVAIAPSVVEIYSLKVADVYVTSKNCNDLSVINGVSGKVRYNPETKTLYLENATITGYNGIYNGGVSGLTINVAGDNNITATKDAAISLTYSTTITGDGTLNVESNGYCGLYFKKSLEIDNCTVNTKGKWGIAGVDGTVETLTIRNATVTAEGSSGSICDILSLKLDGCEISKPYRAVFDESMHAVVLDGQTVTDQVVITTTPANIKDVKVEVPARKQGIYSIDGVYLGQDFDALPKGLYIKDGRKVVK